jgi:hypothetical protein
MTAARLRPVERATLLFFVLFLLVFPKGGIKVADVPITWGYIGLAPVFALFLYRLYDGAAGAVRTARLLVLGLLVPFQVIGWTAFLLNGVGNLGFSISFAVTFFFIPLVLVLVLGMELDRIDLTPLLRALRVAIPLIAAYGIVLFAYKLATGEFIEIPYLTVNAGDVGELDEKYIDRGGVFKLISTYNNGNIYGVSLLILLPLYTWLERSPVRTGIVKLSLLLTLSRTVWAGLLVHEVVQRLYVRRISAKALAALTGVLALIVGGIGYSLHLMDRSLSFVADRTLGGRIDQLETLRTATLFPSTEFEAIAEMVYLSILENFGILGLFTFLIGMSAPLALYFSGALPFAGTAYKRSLAAGLLLYLFVALSDGAILFIPVMVFYWFVVSLLLSDNASFSRASEAAAPGGG